MNTAVRINKGKINGAGVKGGFLKKIMFVLKNMKLWFVALALLMLVSYMTTSILPLFLAALIVNYMIITYALAFFSGRKLSYNIKLEGSGQVDGTVNGHIVLKNNGWLPCFFLKGTLEIKNHLTGLVDGGMVAASVWPKREKQIDFQFTSKCCGKVSVTLKDLKSAEPVGMFKGLSREAAGKGRQFVIMPTAEILPADMVDFSHYDMESYKFSQLLKGNDISETIGMKNYEKGDSVKSIHWKLSSKLDDVVVRELGYPISNSVVLIVDKIVDEIDEGKIDKLMNKAATMCRLLEEKEIKYQLIWTDQQQRTPVVSVVRNQGEGNEAIVQLVSRPVSLEGSSAAAFLEGDIDRNQKIIIFLTSRKQIDEEVNLLRPYGEVQIYREK